MIEEILRSLPKAPPKLKVERLPAQALTVIIRDPQTERIIEGRGIDFTHEGVGVKVPELPEAFEENIDVNVDISLSNDVLSARCVPGKLCYSREWEGAFRIGIKFTDQEVAWYDSKLQKRLVAIEEQLAADRCPRSTAMLKTAR